MWAEEVEKGREQYVSESVRQSVRDLGTWGVGELWR